MTALTLAPAPASADIQIVYQVADLPDPDPGADLWRYTYTVSGQAFAAGYGFSIYFPWQSFGAIELLETPTEGWDPIAALNPDGNLDLPGLLAAQTNQNLAANTWQFAVTVIWLDGLAVMPGSQRYELFDADFNVLDPPGTLGTVAQVIPEPQTGPLLFAGLLLLSALAMRRRVRGSGWWG